MPSSLKTAPCPPGPTASPALRCRRLPCRPADDRMDGRTGGSPEEAALIRASDWLNRKVMWNGRKASRSQRMAWPRSGVVTQDGEIAPDEIPAEVVEACCELAGFFVEQDYLAPLDRGGDIASLSVDVISIAYNGTAPAETVFPSLSGLLAGLGTVCTGKGGGIMEVGRG
ncbi:MAG: DnaT-like ssDNA-binding protein [Bilophila wadsworthia]